MGTAPRHGAGAGSRVCAKTGRPLQPPGPNFQQDRLTRRIERFDTKFAANAVGIGDRTDLNQIGRDVACFLKNGNSRPAPG
jgi:hypothetical protein